MKSYINELADFREAPIEKDIVIKMPEEYLEGKLKVLSRGSKKFVPADIVETGDTVELKLESKLPKFNKESLKLSAGLGLFDKELEEALVGKNVGETFDFEKDGTPVKVTVKEITRTVFPEPDDEMAKAYCETHIGFEGIDTLDGYIKFVTDEYYQNARDDAFYEKIEEVLDYVLTHSDFEFDEGEVKTLADESIAMVNEELESIGKTLDTATDEDIENTYGMMEIKTKEDLNELIQSQAEIGVATMLVMAKDQGLDSKEVEMDDFNVYAFDSISEYLREVLNIKEER